jgi:DNA-binding NarL/FixJ family response regulator
MVVVAPVLDGRRARHLRRQNAELTRLAAELREERTRAEEAAVGAERGAVGFLLKDVTSESLLDAVRRAAAGGAGLTPPE